MSHADEMIAHAEARRAQALADSNNLEALRAESEIARWQGIRSRVDLAPPLSPAVRDQLRVLLRPAAAPQQSPRRARPLREAA